MNLSELTQLDQYRFAIKQSSKPVILYGSQDLLADMDEKVRSQIENVAHLPGLIGPAFTMPDAHCGYGFPIGGVAAFDTKNGVISAGGVGFDISCGIRCLRSNLTLPDVQDRLDIIAERLFKAIPAGVGCGGHLHLAKKEIDAVLTQGAKWAVKNGFGNESDLTFIEDQGCVAHARADYVSDNAKARQYDQMGTLGSGNHYLEIEVVEKVFDAAAAKVFQIEEGQIIIAIHCGSRGLGHQIASDYIVSLTKAAKKAGIVLPERELACAYIQSEEGQHYFGAMLAGMNCALANRQILTSFTRDAFSKLFPEVNITTLYDVSHNTCKRENHFWQGQWHDVYVHRKGATRALPPQHPDLPESYREAGQPVFIGGSMGTGSYLLAGNPTAQNQAFASASHGAGRRMSRHQALKTWQGRQVLEELKSQGIYIRSSTMRGIAEEAPGAYKDVDEVALATEGAGLARRVAYLRPLACVKG